MLGYDMTRFDTTCPVVSSQVEFELIRANRRILNGRFTGKQLPKVQFAGSRPLPPRIASELHLERSYDRPKEISAVDKTVLRARYQHEYIDVGKVRQFAGVRLSDHEPVDHLSGAAYDRLELRGNFYVVCDPEGSDEDSDAICVTCSLHEVVPPPESFARVRRIELCGFVCFGIVNDAATPSERHQNHS